MIDSNVSPVRTRFPRSLQTSGCCRSYARWNRRWVVSGSPRCRRRSASSRRVGAGTLWRHDGSAIVGGCRGDGCGRRAERCRTRDQTISSGGRKSWSTMVSTRPSRSSGASTSGRGSFLLSPRVGSSCSPRSSGSLVAHYAGVPVRFTIDGATGRRPRSWMCSRPGRRAADSPERECGCGRWRRSSRPSAESGRASLLYGFPSPRPLRLGVLQLGYDAVEPQPIVISLAPPARPPQAVAPFFRAELAADWEPRLDGLWRRVRRRLSGGRDSRRRSSAVIVCGSSRLHYHRFLDASLDSAGSGGFCRLSDRRGPLPLGRSLVGPPSPRRTRTGQSSVHRPGRPDRRRHRGALAQRRRRRSAAARGRGFARSEVPGQLVMVARAFDPELDVTKLDGRVYLTMADADLV